MKRTVTWRVLPTISVFYSEADIEWLRSCGLHIYIKEPKRLSVNDSGWCDATTGYQILTSSHEIYVTTETPEQETWVKLYWESRAYEFEIKQFDAINTMNAFMKG